MKATIVIILIYLFAFIKCNFLSPPSLDDLYQNIDLWESQNIISYSAEVTQECVNDCVPGTFVINVEAGEITTCEPFTADCQDLPTVEDVFDIYLNAISQDYMRSASFDETLGYITYVHFETVNQISLYIILNFKNRGLILTTIPIV